VIAVKHERYTPAAKTNNYIEGVKQAQQAKTINAVEPIYYSDAQVFEGSNSNIFAVIDGKLLTCPVMFWRVLLEMFCWKFWN
jgi:branched-subunit amino acid aminotransferase/4-amino-4-deoxychorismate lyase